ncbi:MAG TPA: hypothetical protein VMN99_12925 [Anaerolineales bacterium]|nr:hypothetical protein [Anaerolineales bacterium]
MELKHQIRGAIALGLLSLVAGGLGHLALTDIYHGDGNLTLEWNMLRIFATVFLIFIGYTLITVRKILKTI